MLPSLRIVEAGLRDATEALALELAHPGGASPRWDGLGWRLASAAAAVHGVSPLLAGHVLAGRCHWRHPPWQRFLGEQRDHVEHRQRRIATLLGRIDGDARAAGLAVVPLKGAALHALGLYAPGERPMADIDLLVREGDAGVAVAMLQALGYVESYAQWKHRVFKPVDGRPVHGLGEHRDTPVAIELHVRIQERLPVSVVDITGMVFPPRARPGLNDYPSTAALMAHLLLHAAGGICSRSLRLMHLHDIALLSTRMGAGDWTALCEGEGGVEPWWVSPPLAMVDRYFPRAVPAGMPGRFARRCPLPLRMFSRGQTLTRASCSGLWLHPLSGMEWSRSAAEAGRYLVNRIRPSPEARQERADMIRTQLWLQGQDWARLSHRRRVLGWLSRPVPRMDVLYAVRAAIEAPVLAP